MTEVSSHLELMQMGLGDVLYESGDKLRHVYFPTTSIISLLYVMEDGASAEIAVVGNEGILGISLFMGGETTPSRAIAQSAGHAFRLRAALLKEEFAPPALRRQIGVRTCSCLRWDPPGLAFTYASAQTTPTCRRTLVLSD